jgi:hypothetical protein
VTRRIKSTEFDRHWRTLTEPTDVVRDGKVIGRWQPTVWAVDGIIGLNMEVLAEHTDDEGIRHIDDARLISVSVRR